MREVAVKLERPIIVFVGCEPFLVPGAIVCYEKNFPEVGSRGAVVVGVPDIGLGLLVRHDLPSTATMKKIRMVMHRAGGPNRAELRRPHYPRPVFRLRGG